MTMTSLTDDFKEMLTKTLKMILLEECLLVHKRMPNGVVFALIKWADHHDKFTETSQLKNDGY